MLKTHINLKKYILKLTMFTIHIERLTGLFKCYLTALSTAGYRNSVCVFSLISPSQLSINDLHRNLFSLELHKIYMTKKNLKSTSKQRLVINFQHK